MKLHYEDENWNYQLIIYPIMAFVIIFFLWATFMKIDEVVKGEGKVVPSGQTKVLQHFEGGIISEILVKEGDSVKKGDILYKIKNEYFLADLNSQKLEMMALKAKSMRLQALIDNQTLVFPKEFEEKIGDIIQNELQIFEEENANKKRLLGISQDQLEQKNSNSMS